MGRWGVYRPTVIVGLFAQQAIAMFVLKSGAGFSIFKWIAFLASDFLAQALQGAEFFFDADTINKHWFFVNTVCGLSSSLPVCRARSRRRAQLSSIIFFIAFVQMMYYLGVMKWLIKGLCVLSRRVRLRRLGADRPRDSAARGSSSSS